MVKIEELNGIKSEFYIKSILNIKNSFNKLKYKKLIVMGKGSLFREIDSIINIKPNINMFIESQLSESNDTCIPTLIINDFLKSTQLNEDFLILVCTSYFKEILSNLDKENLDNLLKAQIFNPIEDYKWQLELKNLPIYKLETKMHKFIDRIDTNNFLESNGKRMIVFVSEWSGKAAPYQLITNAIILKHRGYNVTILYNDCSEYGDWSRGEGFSAYQHNVYLSILEKVREKFKIDIHILSEYQQVELNDFEVDRLKKYTYYTQIWNSRKYIINSKDEYNIKISSSLEKVLRLLKDYFTSNSYDSALIWTGIHNYYDMANIIMTSLKIPYYTEEYFETGYAFIKNGPVVFQTELPKYKKEVLNNNDKLRRIILSFGEKLFEQRANFLGYESEKNSVVIPLNIFWDSAAFTNNDLFLNFYDWLKITVKFIIEECQTHVYIRQHPHEKKFNSGKDLMISLEREFGNSEYYHFVDANSNISTYDLLKNAKLVLPNTSTVGVEAAILEKPVILKNDVYYSDEKFVYKSVSTEDYLSKIKKILLEEEVLKLDKEEALISYALITLGITEKSFGHFYPEVEKWIELDLEEIIGLKSVQQFLALIENDISIYNSVIQHFQENL